MRLLITLFAFLLSAALYGQNDYSMSFSNDIVDFGTINNFPQSEFTISFWENIHSNATEQAIISFAAPGHDNEFMYMYSTGVLDVWLGQSQVIWGITHSLNTWDYVTLTWSSITGALILYRNGILEAQSIHQQGVSISSSGYLVLGQEQDSYGGAFNSSQALYGSLDNIQIWNLALSQEQIQQYMNCPPTGNEEGLLGCWNFEEGNGTTAFDQTANGNDGEVNGATWSTDVPELDCVLCIDPIACNYNPYATEDDGSCDYTCCPGPGCCTDGMYWDWDAQGCFITNPSDINLDGCVQLDDLLDLLSAYGDCGAPSFICGDPVDHQGYSYSTVLIGEQCWFKENCRYLPDVTDSSVESFTEPLYYVYDYEGDNVLEAKQTSNYEDFGVLYNFVAATSDNICPSEWHPPTELEFLELIDFAGGPEIAGDALKAEEGWADSYIEMQGSNGSNSSGFTAVPNGYFSNATGFTRLYTYGWMWTSTSIGELNGRYLQLFTHTETAGTTSASNFYGFSARCIKD